MAKENLRDVESHFEFGENWASYSEKIDEASIQGAHDGLLRLFSDGDLKDSTFLDIGCGSGIHTLAAAKLGVKSIHAVDIDANSVQTTRKTLERFMVDIPSTVESKSVFDMDENNFGLFDIVYSWGVLHHTGDLDNAMKRAANLVAPGGLFAFALYRRTRLDWFWLREKKWYSNVGPKRQKFAQKVFKSLYKTASVLSGKGMNIDRGMDHSHDVHDWLGGYPYEAILAPEVEAMMEALNFQKIREFARPVSLGLFGSGCDEYVYRKGVR